MQVGKLKLLKSSHLSQRYDLEDKLLKKYPAEIKSLTERIEGYKADIETVKQNTPAEKETFPPMKIGGNLFAEKADAGKALIEACKAMTSPDPIALGEYRGFGMDLSFDSFAKEYRVTLKGALSHTAALGMDVHGNITRLDNVIEGLPQRLKSCEEQLAAVRTQAEAARSETERPFPQEAELSEKAARLAEVNIALNLDRREPEIIESEAGEGEIETPEKSSRARER
jgi:hypothetical protein